MTAVRTHRLQISHDLEAVTAVVAHTLETLQNLDAPIMAAISAPRLRICQDLQVMTAVIAHSPETHQDLVAFRLSAVSVYCQDLRVVTAIVAHSPGTQRDLEAMAAISAPRLRICQDLHVMTAVIETQQDLMAIMMTAISVYCLHTCQDLGSRDNRRGTQSGNSRP